MDTPLVVFIAAVLIRVFVFKGSWFGPLGRLVGFAVSPIMGKVIGPSGMCPHCGFLVGAHASSCAKCGHTPSLARLAAATPAPSVRPAQTTRTGPIVPMGQCPNCEDIIPMSSQSCPVCRYKPESQGWGPA